MPVTIVLRSVKGSALTSAEADANFSNLKAFIEAFETQINARLNPDGTLKAGAVSATDKIADGVVTIAKIANQTAGNAKKVFRVDASGDVVLADFPKAFEAADSAAVTSTGTQTAFSISSIAIPDVPAGDILVNATLWALANAGDNGGTVTLKVGATEIGNAPTHIVDVGSQWVPLPIHGKLANFAGGTLTLDFVFETGQVSSDITFGVGGDGRFGRKVSLVAGL